jgi:hypothetical protein
LDARGQEAKGAGYDGEAPKRMYTENAETLLGSAHLMYKQCCLTDYEYDEELLKSIESDYVGIAQGNADRDREHMLKALRDPDLAWKLKEFAETFPSACGTCSSRGLACGACADRVSRDYNPQYYNGAASEAAKVTAAMSSVSRYDQQAHQALVDGGLNARYLKPTVFEAAVDPGVRDGTKRWYAHEMVRGCGGGSTSSSKGSHGCGTRSEHTEFMVRYSGLSREEIGEKYAADVAGAHNAARRSAEAQAKLCADNIICKKINDEPVNGITLAKVYGVKLSGNYSTIHHASPYLERGETLRQAYNEDTVDRLYRRFQEYAAHGARLGEIGEVPLD